VAFSTKIYCKFTVECAVKIKTSQHLAKLQARKLIVSHTLILGTVLLKDEEIARYLDLSMAVVDCFYVDFDLA